MEEMAARLIENTQNSNSESAQTGEIPIITEAPKHSLTDKAREIPKKMKNLREMMIRRIQEFIINSQEQWCAYAVLAGIAVLILLGLMFIILRRITYGEMLMSAGFCMGILTLLLCAGNLGLPVLMDPARCSIYYVYLLIVSITVLEMDFCI